MKPPLALTQRELNEIEWAMLYASHFSQDGYDRLCLISRLAVYLGFEMDGQHAIPPDHVILVDEFGHLVDQK